MCACYGKSCNDSAKNIDEVGNSIKKFAPACSPEPSIRTRASVHASSWNRALKLYRMAFSKHLESLVVFVSRCSVGVDRRRCPSGPTCAPSGRISSTPGHIWLAAWRPSKQKRTVSFSRSMGRKGKDKTQYRIFVFVLFLFRPN